jgi:hypothetical protein
MTRLPFIGLDRHVDVALRLTTPPDNAAAAARAMGAILAEFPAVPARLAGVGHRHGDVELTFVVTLGSVEQVAQSSPDARDALAVLHRITTSLSAYEPCFTTIPERDSIEARAARQLLERDDNWLSVQQDAGSHSTVSGVAS